MSHKTEMRPSRQARRRTTVKNHSRLYISDETFLKLAVAGGCILSAYISLMFWGVIPCP